jgi:hypothetical protein
MDRVPFTADNPLPKDFVEFTSQLADLFVHPWALNVPMKESEYLLTKEGKKLKYKGYEELESTQTFMKLITKGPLKDDAKVNDVTRFDMSSSHLEQNFVLDTGLLEVTKQMTEIELQSWAGAFLQD